VSRSGYSDELDDWQIAMWRGRVASAMRGKRGQRLLSDALAALKLMPEKRLISGELVQDGDVCLLGACGKHRRVEDIDKIDPHDHCVLAERFDVAECLIKEIEHENDEGTWQPETPEQRYERMRNWLTKNIARPEAK
jgi:hypothetical protein